MRDPKYSPQRVRAKVQMHAPGGVVIECEMDMVVQWATNDPRADPFYSARYHRDHFADMRIYDTWLEVVSGRTTGGPITVNMDDGYDFQI